MYSDISSVFGAINHDLLLMKLSNYYNFLGLFYLIEHRPRVLCIIIMCRGSPYGPVLDAFLFLEYVNDLSVNISSCN